ncbi:MAG: hypothetical protein LBP42_07270 [Treponema sp.]|jgi:hypothetical protein|nr:hypothetical protein [Treponema sp.]
MKTPAPRILPGFLLLLCISGGVCPQDSPSGDFGDGSYLIPRTVFVGDRGSLVVPLEAAFLKVPPYAVQNPVVPALPEELRINRIALEHRDGLPRLLIDFTAYAPGVFSLPPIAVPPSAPRSGSVRLTGLRLTVASILNEESLVLSPPAPPLSVPGTALMIYKTLGGIFILSFVFIGGKRWAWDRLKHWGEGRRRRRLVLGLAKRIKRLRRDLVRRKPGLPGLEELFSRIAGEFRVFFGLFTRADCRAFTAEEFPALFPEESSQELDPRLSGPALRDLFHRWDALRFSGKDVAEGEFLGVLDELLGLLTALEGACRRRPFPEAPGSGVSGLFGSEKPGRLPSPGGAG